MGIVEAQKAIIHLLWEAGKIQNEIGAQVWYPLSAISEITRPTS